MVGSNAAARPWGSHAPLALRCQLICARVGWLPSQLWRPLHLHRWVGAALQGGVPHDSDNAVNGANFATAESSANEINMRVIFCISLCFLCFSSCTVLTCHRRSTKVVVVIITKQYKIILPLCALSTTVRQCNNSDCFKYSISAVISGMENFGMYAEPSNRVALAHNSSNCATQRFCTSPYCTH